MRLFCLPLALALLPLPAPAQSLGEAARKEEQRRQKNKEKGVNAPVYDDSRFPKKEPTPAASPATKAGGASPAPPGAAAAPVPAPTSEPDAGDAETEQRRQQEEMWRGRMAAARAKRDEAKKRHDYLNSLWLGPNEYYVDEKGEVLVRSLEHLRELIGQAKAELDAAEKGIADLEESARRSGALPGWLR